jgi:UDP-glucose 4-epimerase
MDEKHPYNPSTPYAASKVAGDQIVESYRKTFGIDSRIIRPFNNYGPKQNSQSYAGIIPIVIRSAMRNEPINIFGDGQQTRDYVFVGDTARTILSLSEAYGGWEGAVNVATGVEVSVNNLVSDILTLMNKQNTPVIHIDPRPGDVRRHAGDTSLLEGLVGFKPIQMNEGFLSETIEWYERSALSD